jgi:hypothetical protein
MINRELNAGMLQGMAWQKMLLTLGIESNEVG